MWLPHSAVPLRERGEQTPQIPGEGPGEAWHRFWFKASSVRSHVWGWAPYPLSPLSRGSVSTSEI
jgi:hypothetical protein